MGGGVGFRVWGGLGLGSWGMGLAAVADDTEWVLRFTSSSTYIEWRLCAMRKFREKIKGKQI